MSARTARVGVAAASAAPRPLPPRPTRAAAARAPLAVVPPRPARAGRTSFILLLVVLLSGGLAALLGFNTALAQGSFTVSELQKRAAELDDQGQSMEEKLARAAAPERLAAQARRIGMVPAPGVAFVGLSDASITGQAVAAPGVAPPLIPLTPEQKAKAKAQRAQDDQAKAEQAEEKRIAAEQAAIAKAAQKQRLAAEKAAAAAEAARLAAEKEWKAKLAGQNKAGPQSGGEQVVDPPAGN